MWDTRYRPRVFGDVLGQEGSVRVLRARLTKGEGFNTSYIFAGGHGSGKTTLARILARALLCHQLRDNGDPCNECEHCVACLEERMGAFTELDAASQGTTADMRRLVEHLAYDYPGVKKRIYLLDEAHRMSRDAQDVLLKPIEDNRVVVLFCTTEGGKLRDTIKSRCELYDIRKIQREDILGRVRRILEEEKVEFEDDAVLTVIDYARGHVRDVLNRLETIAQLGPITMEAVRERLDLSMVSVYYDVLLALGDAPRVIELVESACGRVGPAQVATGLAEAAMNAYRQAQKIYTEYSAVDRQRAAQVYERFGSETSAVARYFVGLGPYASDIDVVCAALAFGADGGVPARAVSGPREVPVIVAPAPAAPSPAMTAPSAAVAPAAPVVLARAPEVASPASQTAVAPAVPQTLVSTPTKPARPFHDGNVPRCTVDQFGMLAPGSTSVGPAVRAVASKPKVEALPPVERSGPLTPLEFTAAVKDALRRCFDGN